MGADAVTYSANFRRHARRFLAELNLCMHSGTLAGQQGEMGSRIRRDSATAEGWS
jgi:hypothetical protein